MEIHLGNKGLNQSWQLPFKEQVDCPEPGCNGNGRIAFVATEHDEKEYVRDIHDNNPPDNYWLHDSGAFAVYICGKCFRATARFNQA